MAKRIHRYCSEPIYDCSCDFCELLPLTVNGPYGALNLPIIDESSAIAAAIIHQIKWQIWRACVGSGAEISRFAFRLHLPGIHSVYVFGTGFFPLSPNSRRFLWPPSEQIFFHAAGPSKQVERPFLRALTSRATRKRPRLASFHILLHWGLMKRHTGQRLLGQAQSCGGRSFGEGTMGGYDVDLFVVRA